MSLQPAAPLRVAYTGSRAGEGPTTLGQRNILQWLCSVDNPITVYQRRVIPVPDGTGVDEVTGALSTLLSRHEGLRTTFGSGAAPRQFVVDSGELPVEVFTTCVPPGEVPDRDGLAAELSAELARRLVAEPPDPRRAPIRAAVVHTVDGHALLLALECSHLAADQHAMALLVEQARRMLATPAERHQVAAPLQPLDLAAQEQQPPMRQRVAAALSYWESQLRRMPGSLCAVPYPDAPVELGTGCLSSPAAAAALLEISRRARVSPASAVLAAVCAVSAQRGGYAECVVPMLSGNRFERTLAGCVGTLVQSTVATVDVAGAGFDDLARRAWLATVRAGSHGRYDIAERVALAKRIGYERGLHFSFEPVFNNLSGAGVPPAVPTAPGLRWVAGAYPPAPQPRLDLFGVEGSLVLALTGAGCRMARGEVESLLRAVERLLVAAGTEDLAPHLLAEVVGLPPLPSGPRWRLVESTWVHLGAVQRLAEQALAPAAVRVAADRAGQALVAFLTADGPAGTPAEAHRRCLAALPGRPAVITPSYYVLCDRVPADPSDPTAWERQPVVAAGSGRA